METGITSFTPIAFYIFRISIKVFIETYYSILRFAEDSSVANDMGHMVNSVDNVARRNILIHYK